MPAKISLPPQMKAQPFPASAFGPDPLKTNLKPAAPLLPHLSQGVEQQAKVPAAFPPRVDTSASDKVAALGRAGGPMPAAPALPAPTPTPVSGPGMQAMSPAPVNPLGGMDPRPLSERGNAGPMSYAPRGAGTNNPNAFAVGKNNKNFNRRVGGGVELPPRGQSVQPGPMMLGGPRPSSPAPSPAAAPDIRSLSPSAGRDDAFWAEQDNTAFLAEQDALRTADAAAEAKAMQEQADRERSMQVSTTPIPGTDYVIPFAGGKAMGTLPVHRTVLPPEPGLMAIPGTNLRMPTLGGERIAGAPLLREEPAMQPLPSDLAGPPTPTTKLAPVEKDQMPKFTADPETGRLWYVVPNGKGGFTRKWVEDTNGDGIPDPLQSGPTAPVQTQGQTKSGIKFSVK